MAEFCHYLAAHLSPRIAAIAPVAGGIADPFHLVFKPERPVSVCILQNTADPLLPYGGGGIVPGPRGKVIATDAAVKLWVTHNGCTAEPQISSLPDKNADDGCIVRSKTWQGGREGSEVTLNDIEGGGHTWPGGPQYLPERIIGKVCRDFDATAAIWAFFKNHPKR